MTAGDVYEKAFYLKVFQIWELVKALEEDWGFLGRSYVKTRVESWVANQFRYGFIKKINNHPPIFAFIEFSNNWKEYVRYKTCPICSSSFIPKNSQEKYCSDQCKARADYLQKKEKKREYLKARKDLTRKASNKYKAKLQQMTTPRKKGKWSIEEVEFLLNAIKEKGKLSKKDLVEIANELGRSFKSVENKYYSLLQ